MINELDLEADTYGSYGVVATHFRKLDSTTGKYLKINIPEDENEFEQSEKIDSPIYEVTIDENDPEICFITKYLPERNNNRTPMIYSMFLNELNGLPKKCRKYEVVTSAWTHLDQEYTGRLDSPLIAVLVDEENKYICMVEAPSE
jgi:leucyl-tRNA synthetase